MSSAKGVIVNADDRGRTPGINPGFFEAQLEILFDILGLLQAVFDLRLSARHGVPETASIRG